MSMNLFLRADLDAETKLGKKVISEFFELLKTPTNVSYALEKGDTLVGYRSWVTNTQSNILGEVSDYGESHLEMLDRFLEEHSGWDIVWGVW